MALVLAGLSSRGRGKREVIVALGGVEKKIRLREDPVEHLERLLALARHVLIIEFAPGKSDHYLWEHSERVMRLAQRIARLPELASRLIDGDALVAAGLFHDAGWAGQARQGSLDRWQILARPTNDIQRELGAGLLTEQAGVLLSPESLHLAAQAIRECNDRGTRIVEAQILAEAESLDEMGVMYVLRQFRHYQAEGRPLEQVLKSWTRQREYHYWDARINDGLHFASTRRLAQGRLKAVESFMAALARDHACDDVIEAAASTAQSA